MNRKGFTLIEILVVITIISILMSLLFVAYEGSRKAGRDAKRKADLEQIRGALEMYRSDKGYYPPGYNPPDMRYPAGWATVLWGCGNNTYYNDVADALISSGYLPSLPGDPLYNGQLKDYYYWFKNNNQYELYSILETNDNNSYPTNPGWACNITDGDKYDYKVTSP